MGVLLVWLIAVLLGDRLKSGIVSTRCSQNFSVIGLRLLSNNGRQAGIHGHFCSSPPVVPLHVL